ncbi:MAG TPA: hypothetical protein VJY33_22965, partial [Isosphaeraceae bacterium]|nr:hypothetical protein [Isosphaeraceae bacterium]
MFSMRRKNAGIAGRHLRRGVSLALLVVAAESGCSREFYREWANQDASEAVFEKSRDPRWRLDAFTIEPPAMSRFADPYDPEFPPAPPDDPAAEALSPVPQWPDHRLITPAEGTGYLDMMDTWTQEREAYQREMAQERAAGRSGQNGAGDGKPAQPSVAPRPPQTPSPFAPGAGGGRSDAAVPGASSPATSPAAPGLTVSASPGSRAPSGPSAGSVPAKPNAARNPRKKSGPGPRSSTPTELADGRLGVMKASIPPPRSASSFALGESRSTSRSKDDAVQRTAAQADARLDSSAGARADQSAGPGQAPPGEAGLPPQPLVPTDSEASERQKAEQIRRQVNQIGPPRPGGTFTPEQAAELSSVLIPQLPPLNINAYTGLPTNAHPYVVTMQQAFTLALINSRIYQLQLENLYSTALAVTLQRFQFEPQFYAGMSPLTPPLGSSFPGTSPINQFLYRTRSAPGGQASTLNLGEVAGVGKLFNSGAQLLMGFANQIVFNFVGKNPIQPTVQSALPLTFFQPLLRGAGRAVTLEPLTEAERNLLYQARIFAQFRQQFIVVTLTGGTITQPGVGFNLQGFSTSGNTDPTLGFIPVAVNYGNVIIDRRNVAYFEQLAALYAQLIEGESSGLSQLQVDQVKSNLLLARGTLISDILTLRNSLDSFKQQLGLPPDTPMVPDLSLVQPFIDVYEAIDEWQRGANRKIEDIDKLLESLPELEDIILDGHSVLGMYKNSKTFDQEEDLEGTLQAAVRIALEYRLDLMNTRAQLYDAWRNIRVTANALKGYLNVAL